MIKERKNQNLVHYGFTLLEMVIVLIIMGIMILVTLRLSGDQIQKVKDKTVKESILAEMQSRYSRNLWSSSFGWEMYDTMTVDMKNGGNNIDFEYKYWDKVNYENTFMDKFEIKYIGVDYDFTWTPPATESELKLEYNPYKIACKIWDNKKSATIIVRVNDNKNYCFEIKQKNCRLIEVSADKCEVTTKLAIK